MLPTFDQRLVDRSGQPTRKEGQDGVQRRSIQQAPSNQCTAHHAAVAGEGGRQQQGGLDCNPQHPAAPPPPTPLSAPGSWCGQHRPAGCTCRRTEPAQLQTAAGAAKAAGRRRERRRWRRGSRGQQGPGTTLYRPAAFPAPTKNRCCKRPPHLEAAHAGGGAHDARQHRPRAGSCLGSLHLLQALAEQHIGDNLQQARRWERQRSGAAAAEQGDTDRVGGSFPGFVTGSQTLWASGGAYRAQGLERLQIGRRSSAGGTDVCISLRCAYAQGNPPCPQAALGDRAGRGRRCEGLCGHLHGRECRVRCHKPWRNGTRRSNAPAHSSSVQQYMLGLLSASLLPCPSITSGRLLCPESKGVKADCHEMEVGGVRLWLTAQGLLCAFELGDRSFDPYDILPAGSQGRRGAGGGLPGRQDFW